MQSDNTPSEAHVFSSESNIQGCPGKMYLLDTFCKGQCEFCQPQACFTL